MASAARSGAAMISASEKEKTTATVIDLEKGRIYACEHYCNYCSDEKDRNFAGVLAIYQTLPFCSFFQKVPFDMDFI